jgi:hypothetical protein
MDFATVSGHDRRDAQGAAFDTYIVVAIKVCQINRRSGFSRE